MEEPLAVAVVGASGYTGAELLRLLLVHPRIRIASICADRAAGKRIDEVFPQFRGRLDMPIAEFDPAAIAGTAQLVFTALPHGHSARAVDALRQRDLKVIDLSADFRLDRASVYEEWYASADELSHPAVGRLAEAVYGLPELHRERIRTANLVAAPGCYPTSAILASAPLLHGGLVEASGIVVDSKSGVSGAGRSPGLATHFPELGEGIRPYKIAGTHRHTPEIEQELSKLARGDVSLSFTPHLVPMSRGILSCVYARPTDSSRNARVYQEAFEKYYENEPFVSVLGPDALPDTSFVRGSNRVHLAVRYDARAKLVVAIAAIDNLCKGSSGQALQCCNLMQGWPEDMGLEAVAAFP